MFFLGLYSLLLLLTCCSLVQYWIRAFGSSQYLRSNLSTFSSHSKLPTGNFWDTAYSINRLHPDILDMMILCFDFSLLYIYYLPQIPFSTLCNILIFLNNSNSISILFTHAWHANAGVDKKRVGSNSKELLEFSNTSTNDNLFLYKCKP